MDSGGEKRMNTWHSKRARAWRWYVVVLALAISILRGIAAGHASGPCVELPEMNAWFRWSRGWIGGDGVFTIPLDGGRILWLFSDSFVGRVAEGQRRRVTMVHNAVAIQKHAAARPDIFLGKAADGGPASFFDPPDRRGYFWLFHGATNHQGLWLFLIQVETTDATSAFGFRTIGTWLAHVANPHEPPPAWRVSMRKIPWGIYPSDDGGRSSGEPADGDARRTLHFGSWVTRVGDELYVYGVDERLGKRGMIVAKVPVSRIGRFDRWRFLGPDGWVKDFRACRTLADDITTEYSVTPMKNVPGKGEPRYLLIQSAGNLSPDILAREGPSPVGPWSEPRVIFTCPEPARRQEVFTYAAKAHPELSDEAGTVISYVANSVQFKDLVDHAWIYWPRFIRLPAETRFSGD